MSEPPQTKFEFVDDVDFQTQVSKKLKDSTTTSRAAMIWDIWKLIVKEDDEMELEDFKYPLLKKISDADLSIKDVRKVAEVEADSTEEAIETVKTAKREAEKTEGYVLNQIQIGSATSEALAEAARNEKTTREDVVKEAIQTHLRLDGCLNEVSE